MNHSIGTICSLIDDALHIVHQNKKRKKANPYADQCYVASATLKEYFPDELTFYKTKDHVDVWHWWVETNEGEVIDLTSKQYELIGVPVPSLSEAASNKTKQRKLGFSSYRKRVNVLKEIVDQKLEKLNQSTVAYEN